MSASSPSLLSAAWPSPKGPPPVAAEPQPTGGDGPRPNLSAACDVLVVDDAPDILEAVVQILEFEGYVPRRAMNGSEALRLVEQAPPRIVLLDMRMPVMDGWSFAAA